MKIQLETIPGNENRSFSLMFNPRLSDLFFWHFHPEYELVYIEGATGTRHVGDHIRTYRDSDLVLIGSNIPHLNFDYGVKTDYCKVVVHLKKEFVEEQLIKMPELTFFPDLIRKSRSGVAFFGQTKEQVGSSLKELENLDPFEQYLQLLQIFRTLAATYQFELLHKDFFPMVYNERDQGRMRELFRFVDQYYHRKIELKEVAHLTNLTRSAFCRYFKNATHQTFIQFLNRYRVSQAKRRLMSGQTIGNACFACGFESLSYFNRVFKRVTGENPSTFRNRYL